jgi:threonine dehydrogenase-like Zn-dependent dehydrogenase
MMKGIAVIPGRPDSLHIVYIPTPNLDQAAGGRGVLIKVLQVGLDGTDREIALGQYGAPPSGAEFLVLGHESLGIVEQVDSAVKGISPGDYVVAMVRMSGQGFYDFLGTPDMSVEECVPERGINGIHGFLTERYLDVTDNLILVPPRLKEVGILLEPFSIVEKGVIQAYEIQRRLQVWKPQCVAVLGTGTIGLLATLILRLRGLDVTALARRESPYLNADLVEDLGARYVSTKQMSLADTSQRFGPFDLIFEATGYSPLAFEAMENLGRNGVLVLSSVTGGDVQAEVRADAINLDFVLGNKVMVGTVNANRGHYSAAVRDIAHAESQFPGWLRRIITHRINGLDNYMEAFHLLAPGSGAIKVVVDIAVQKSGPGGYHN